MKEGCCSESRRNILPFLTVKTRFYRLRKKAAEEKATRRHWYICARVATDNLVRNIQRIENGASSQADKLEFLRAQLAHSRRRVAEFEAEFVDDPDIERDVYLEIQATEDIARALGQKGAVDK